MPEVNSLASHKDRLKRFFVQKNQGNNCKGTDDAVLILSGIEHNHLANVLRMRVGEEVIITCGDEFDYYYEIVSINKSGTSLRLVEKKQNIFNPKKSLTVFLGVIKHDNLVFAVEKLNEIGATEIVLFKSANCQNIPVKFEKLQAVANQSCKQCGRSIPLKVSGVLSFGEMVKALPKNTVFADEKERAGKMQSADAIIIGPEGGFLDSEREVLSKAATPISLGARILRAETAAIVGASVLMSKMGEL